ncbi:hypothetical protein K470DRAFT_209804 [Piedraia hortae CBS 480.64]|uniref:Pre-rRNA-processing protein TSR2 n=1 Tax=Piedraia hortae CBS 480.64 TaxID=1314780 RepID=A0A6A7C8F7_9PEZI|nr:hypothetical protein K470DRAFT_209804 [Piedraia hortae CBS 480.64]
MSLSPTLKPLLDSSIWYLLSLWPAVEIACSNGWGGPESYSKKDWFAAEIVEYITNGQDGSTPREKQEDLEVFLLNVMADEFETVLEDESEVDVAAGMLKIYDDLLNGDSGAARQIKARWEGRGRLVTDVRVEEPEGEDGEEGEDVEDYDGDSDDEMMDVDDNAQKKKKREKPKAEVDEDGFTKVVRR